MNMACESQHPTMQMYHSHSLVFGMRELRKILIQINICTAGISYAITIHEYVMTDDGKYFNKHTHSTPLWRILPSLDARCLRHKCTNPQSTHLCSIDDGGISLECGKVRVVRLSPKFIYALFLILNTRCTFNTSDNRHMHLLLLHSHLLRVVPGKRNASAVKSHSREHLNYSWIIA